ncbi:MAG TPA: beta-CASP ribonuclease aCPSF1 [Nitrososphaeraceae archaeon]|nr:beta-CASP ribonuclease aCPSF1 [Nitrososphaeraceae archaeon]
MKEDRCSEGDFSVSSAKSEVHEASRIDRTSSNIAKMSDRKRSRMIDRLDDSNSDSLYNSLTTYLPKEASITAARFEGPKIALYTKNPKFALTELTLYLSGLSKTMKKRFVIRTDPSIRLSEDRTRSTVLKLVPKDVSLSAAFCDDATGEVILELSLPEVITPTLIIEIASLTGWLARTRQSPHVPSASIKTIHSTLKSSAKERSTFFQELGKRIFRTPLVVGTRGYSNGIRMDQSNHPTIDDGLISSEGPAKLYRSSFSLYNKTEVLIYCLGGVKQVGRSCFVVSTPESKVMLDCGINPGEPLGLDAFPRIDWFPFTLSDLDAVVLSHAHIDHQGFLPALFRYGYRGPVYCTEPTLPLMTLLQSDSVKIAKANGSYLPYESRDVYEVIKRCITLPYGKPTDISPDITITLNNAGHILGSATVHLNISGTHNVLYSGDYKYARTQLLDTALSVYPRVETLITESTYGNSSDIMPDQISVYDNFTKSINHTLKQGGKVLIPVPAVGRAQEIMLVLDKEMREQNLVECPVHIEGMISEASAIHMSYAHYLGLNVRKSVSSGVNPFQSDYFTIVNGPGKREEVLEDRNPSIIMATSGMLEGGPSVEYFKSIAPIQGNKIIFVSYQINGTLGRRVVDGIMNEIGMMDKNGKVKIIPVNCGTQRIDGFSGHSDYNQIMNFVYRVKPKRVIVNHGEKSKSENIASSIHNRYHLRSSVPDNREVIKLR